MNRAVLQTKQGDGLLRNVVRIEGDPSPVEGHAGFAALMRLLQTLSDQPDMLRHGFETPDTVRFYPGAGCWVVESYAVVPSAAE